MARKRRSTPGPYLLHLELLRDRISDPNLFPYNLPAVRGLATLPFHPKVTFLVGENGTGKSTLLEALAMSIGLNPEGGSRNFNFATRASHSDLDMCLRVAKTVIGRTPARPMLPARRQSSPTRACIGVGQTRPLPGYGEFPMSFVC